MQESDHAPRLGPVSLSLFLLPARLLLNNYVQYLQSVSGLIPFAPPGWLVEPPSQD